MRLPLPSKDALRARPREYTAATAQSLVAYAEPEIANAGAVTQPVNKTAGLLDCANALTRPAYSRLSFTADACVTADGGDSREPCDCRQFDAEPGVLPASDRTLAVTAGKDGLGFGCRHHRIL